MAKKILIIGGGVSGILTARALLKQKLPETTIQLISPSGEVIFWPRLYRSLHKPKLVYKKSLHSLFKPDQVEIIIDTITSGIPDTNRLIGQSGTSYTYDQAILAIGNQTSFFPVSGLKQMVYDIKSEAGTEKLFSQLEWLRSRLEKQLHPTHVQIIGGGTKGVSAAGLIADWKTSLPPLAQAEIAISLIEGASRILPRLNQKVSDTVAKRLGQMGVTIQTRSEITLADAERMVTDDSPYTLTIWTAGVETHQLIDELGLATTTSAWPDITETMQSHSTPTIWLVGDVAGSLHGDLAAIERQSAQMARTMAATAQGVNLENLTEAGSRQVFSVGTGWAIVSEGNTATSGSSGWRSYSRLLRRWWSWL